MSKHQPSSRGMVLPHCPFVLRPECLQEQPPSEEGDDNEDDFFRRDTTTTSSMISRTPARKNLPAFPVSSRRPPPRLLDRIDEAEVQGSPSPRSRLQTCLLLRCTLSLILIQVLSSSTLFPADLSRVLLHHTMNDRQQHRRPSLHETTPSSRLRSISSHGSYHITGEENDDNKATPDSPAVGLNSRLYSNLREPESDNNVNEQQLLVQEGDAIYQEGEWDMAPVVLEKYKLVFFTQAKVGCTVWKQLFRRMAGYQNWKAENTRNLLPWNPRFNGLKYLYHYDLQTASQILTDPTWTRAIFVRDPKERFVSAYLDKAVQNPHFLKRQCCTAISTKTTSTEQNDNDKTVACAEQSISRAQTSPMAFLQFVERYCDNAHWRPQSLRLTDKYWPVINFVGHMETVAEDAERLLRQVGAWEKYGASGWGESSSQGSSSSNSSSSIFQSSLGRTHATSAASRLASLLSASLENELERFYAQDYKHPILNLTKKVHYIQK